MNNPARIANRVVGRGARGPRTVRGSHQLKTFKVSRDPRFEIRVRDVVGPHVNPPETAPLSRQSRSRWTRRREDRLWAARGGL